MKYPTTAEQLITECNPSESDKTELIIEFMETIARLLNNAYETGVRDGEKSCN